LTRTELTVHKYSRIYCRNSVEYYSGIVVRWLLELGIHVRWSTVHNMGIITTGTRTEQMDGDGRDRPFVGQAIYLLHSSRTSTYSMYR
jgi:hypothetical protein